MNSKFTELEQRLRALVTSLQPPMTGAHAIEILDFVNAGEYGVALETLGAILDEEGLRPSENSLGEM